MLTIDSLFIQRREAEVKAHALSAENAFIHGEIGSV
jgi:hypothetical protein